MLPKKKAKPKRKSVLDALMRDMQGTAEQKLALFHKLKAAGGFANVSPAELKSAEDALRSFVGMEK